MPNLLEDLVIDRVDLVDEGANSAAFIQFYKRKEQTNNMTIEEILAKMAPEQAKIVQAALAANEAAVTKAKEDAAAELKTSNDALTKANGELEALKKAAEEAKKNDEADKSKSGSSFDEDETLKSMPESARTMFLKMKAQKDAAEDEVRKAREDEVNAVAVAKAAELKALPVPTETLVKVLKGSTPEMIDVLTAVSSALEGVTLSEVGKRGQGKDATNDAWGAIEKAADEVAKAEGVTKQKAIAEVIKRKPELYKAYLDGGAN